MSVPVTDQRVWAETVGAMLAALTLLFGWLIKHLWETKPDRAEVLVMLSAAQENLRANRDREMQTLIAAFNRQLEDQNKWLQIQMVGNREVLETKLADLRKDIDDLRIKSR